MEAFDEILASNAREISQSSAIRLHNSLGKVFPNQNSSSPSKWNHGKDIPIRHVPAEDNELLVCKAEIDPSTWICKVTNKQLYSYSYSRSLAPAKQKLLYEDLLALGQKQSSLVNELMKFSDWLK